MNVALQAIAGDFGLITQNGLRLGWLKSFNELDTLSPPPDDPIDE